MQTKNPSNEDYKKKQGQFKLTPNHIPEGSQNHADDRACHLNTCKEKGLHNIGDVW